MITHMFISLTMDQKKKPLNTENAICGHLFQTIMSVCSLQNKLLSFFHAYRTFQYNLQPSLPQSPCSQKPKSSEISKNMTLTQSQYMLHPQLWLDGEVNTSDDITWFTQT